MLISDVRLEEGFVLFGEAPSIRTPAVLSMRTPGVDLRPSNDVAAARTVDFDPKPRARIMEPEDLDVGCGLAHSMNPFQYFGPSRRVRFLRGACPTWKPRQNEHGWRA